MTERQTDGQTDRRTDRKLPCPSGNHVFQQTGTIFKLNSLFTCFHYIHIEKNAPPTGGHVFSPILTIFELVREINKTNVLTNFHDDWAKIVTSRVFTRKICICTVPQTRQRPLKYSQF
ncbi:hypothetical protein DPMN_133027 [Dreissena polymorpha]|uniref:Uncharacterized protein n=1 Tax=Dreissena polymorpha TaxID=45954 RepID=A0A9D4JDM1_DREPO|nr:hypothetical protein DPMN_133027 [Dreissena polymorpha]